MTIRTHGALWLGALSIAGCSVLVQPNEARLRDGGGGATDGASPDVSRPDTGMPPGDDVVLPPDDAVVPGMDVVLPPDDVVIPPPDVVVPPPDVVIPPPDGGSTCPTGCNDGVPCTDDRCNEALGRCEFTPNAARCAMGQVCNPAMGGCVTLGCTGDPMCDDGNACNGRETCAGGTCRPGAMLNCSDGNACNGTETCDPRMGCVPGTAPRCDDGQFCNGTETCDRTRGCVPGAAPDCRDGNVCTGDTCNPMGNGGRGACVNSPVDTDMDGFPARMVSGTACVMGTDCNDMDRLVNPMATEVCNTRDDNCNGMTDEGLMCGGTPPNDQCASAQAITLSNTMTTVTVTGTTQAATSQVSSRCGGDGQPDVFYSITYPAGADLRIEATSTSMLDPVLQFIGQSCTSSGSGVFACNDDQRNGTTASRLWVRSSPTGSATRTVVIAVDSFSAMAGTFSLTASLSAPTPAGTCGVGRFDMSTGGTVYHFVQGSGGVMGASCSMRAFGTGEQAYFYGGAGRGVRAVGAATGFQPIVSVRDPMNCMTERGCQSSGSNTTTLNAMPMAGTLVIDGIPNNPGTTYQYALEVVPQ